MTAKIEVVEGDPIEQTLGRFKKAVKRKHQRNWAKRRYGYFEKPSAIRRRKKGFARISRRRLRYGLGGFQRMVSLRELLQR